MKTCACCKTQKPKSDFIAEKRNRDGLSSYCGDCRRAKARAYSAAKLADPEYRAKRNAQINTARSKRFEDPEYRAKQCAYQLEQVRRRREADPIFRQHCNALQRKRMADPEYRAAKLDWYYTWYAERKKDPEVRARVLLVFMAHRQRVKDATPAWANHADTVAVYAEAARRRRLGMDATVDHIIPLHGKEVCGLHIASNMRIIPRSENSSKNNKFLEELLDELGS